MATYNPETNPQYKKDLEEFLEKQIKAKVRAFDFPAHNVRCSQEELKQMGFDSFQHLCEFSIKEGMKTLEKLRKDFIKKYPD